MSFVQDCVDLSRQHLMAGFLAEAEMSCRTALATEPVHAEATHLLGVIALKANRPIEANDLFERAIALNGENFQYHNSRGVLLYGCRQFEMAEVCFRTAVTLNPDDAISQNNLGNALRALGRLAEAEARFREAVEINPRYAEAHNNLGNTLRELGNLEEAEFCLRHSLGLLPDNLDALYNLGTLLLYTGRLEEAGGLFAQVLAADSSRYEAAICLAQVFQGQDRTEDAVALLTGVQTRLPENQAVQYALQLLRSTQVPAWHIPRLNDHERNDAYEAALLRAIRPGDLVLELGAGSALVSMMAARAGAARVIASEPLAALATVARETVALNGYADRVTIVSKKPQDLKLGVDLPRPADVLVSDIVNVGMLAPDMLAILDHARRNLARPGARVIPAAATVWAQLIQADDLRNVSPIRSVSGFDMSRFDQFRAPGYQQIDLATDTHQMLSDPFPAWFFDFRVSMPDSDLKSLTIQATKPGLVQGVAFWFDLHMDEEVVYSSRSAARTNHWKQAVYFFGHDFPVAQGQPMLLGTGYDRTQIHFFI
ncbi:tetratricopeptide repeat protein [Nitrospirillum sp. BR 11163]|uniref:tetratricopeptide repeat protein n=1 Tax=Nitrospirillum sp. BR 11163 TaxID=3104323 RepID=UPI002B002B15|nr:tetratricopeptide repeat protein [Nitrospirillum sp. BR 11163]MEA1675535.1 tetratricopeptide repeat protein [Nitrospirillum sp. BR 11163]